MVGSRSGRGINAQRRLLSTRSNIEDEIQDLRSSSPAPIWLRAVVIDVINDPSEFFSDAERIDSLDRQLANSEVFYNAPRNSVIARIITNKFDFIDSAPRVFWPLLPPHFSLPIKPGEQAWVMFEDPSRMTVLGYWAWRVSEPIDVDDVNYTHGDRKFDIETNLSTSEKAALADNSSNSSTPAFLNGGGTRDTFTLSGDDTEYDSIVDSAFATSDYTPEASPRFTKRPGDAVMQGSNNTLIVLGEDRTKQARKSNDEKKTLAGAIDIVAGRSRTDATAPKTVQNSRNQEEVDKRPDRTASKQSNPNEGDLDFINDRARIYLAMQTDGDANFGITSDVMPTPFESTIDDIAAASFGALKSDEIRIIARKSDDLGVNGSIRIIKEGGDDFAGLFMLPDGTVQLDGSKIFIGRTGGQGPGPSGSEPYIKFSQYKSQMEEAIAIIDELNTNVENLVSAIATAFTGNTTPGFGAPNPSLLATGGTLTTLNPGLKQAVSGKLNALKNKIDQAKSTRIFGE